MCEGNEIRQRCLWWCRKQQPLARSLTINNPYRGCYACTNMSQSLPNPTQEAGPSLGPAGNEPGCALWSMGVNPLFWDCALGEVTLTTLVVQEAVGAGYRQDPEARTLTFQTTQCLSHTPTDWWVSPMSRRYSGMTTSNSSAHFKLTHHKVHNAKWNPKELNEICPWRTFSLKILRSKDEPQVVPTCSFTNTNLLANVYLHFACRWDTVGTGAVKVYIASIFIIPGASPKMCI